MSRKHREKLLIKMRESHLENEPPQADSPLCKLKGRRNVLVKPKIAEQQELEKIQELQKENLKKNEHSMKAAITRAATRTPHYRVLFKPKLVEKRQVDVCPFSFFEWDKERQLQKEKRLDELRKVEVYKFKAQPLPPFYHVSPFKKKVRLLTQKERFELETYNVESSPT